MKPRLSASAVGWALSALLAAQMACSITPVPAALPTGTSTPIPLYTLVTLQSVPYHEESEGPRYQLDAAYPTLVGSDDPRVTNFNSQMAVLVLEDINSFKNALLGIPDDPMMAGSSFQQDFELKSPPGNLFSLRLRLMTYMSGAAHPGSLYQTAAYDLESGAAVTLGQLFLPGSDYLGALAAYCKAELATRDIAFDAAVTGADPTADNYRNWNVTAGGLLITFDEYQVAAYAAGPQEVLVPYADLAAVIDPHGPLAQFLP